MSSDPLTLEQVLAQVFDTGQTLPSISAEQERVHVSAAREHDPEAIHALIRAYEGFFRRNRKSHEPQLGEDIRGYLLEALWAAILVFDFDEDKRLGHYLDNALTTLLNRESETSYGIKIPGSTLRNYWSIWNDAEQDPDAAADKAPAHHMSRETFWAIWAVVNGISEIDEDAQSVSDESQGVLDHYLVDIALAALDDRERQVIMLSFGFLTEGEPLSDSEVVVWVSALADRDKGQKRMSQRTVLTVRGRAIRRMRKVLGVKP